MPNPDVIAAFQSIFDSENSIAQKLRRAAKLLASTPAHIPTLERCLKEAALHADSIKYKEPAEIASPFHRFLAYALTAQKNPKAPEQAVIEVACETYFSKRYTFLGALSLEGTFTKETFISDTATFIKKSANEITLVKAFWPTTPEALAAFSVKIEKPESIQACFAHFKEKAENGVITDKMSLDDCANLLFAKALLAKFETAVLPKLGDDKAVNEALIRQFLKERTDTNQKTGYTGSPDSLANQFCVGLAVCCIDKDALALNFNQSLWQMLMPNIMGVHNIEDNQAWPPYGAAPLDDDLLAGKEGKLWSYPFLLGASQSTGVFANWQNKPLPEECEDEAENIAKLLALPLFQNKPSPETWYRVFAFRPEHRDFWLTQQAALSEKKPIENLFEFFTGLDAVLDKFKQNENDPTDVEFDISYEGQKAISPFLETWHAFLKQKSGQAFEEMATGKETPLQKNIKTLVEVMKNLIQPGNVKQHIRSCFRENHDTLSAVLEGEDKASVSAMLIDFQISKTFRPAPELSKTCVGRDDVPHDAELYSRMTQGGMSRAVLRENLLNEIVSAMPAAATLPDLICAAQEWVQAEKIEARDKALFNFVYEINDPDKRTQFLKPFLEQNLPFDNTLENYSLKIKMLHLVSEHHRAQRMSTDLINHIPNLRLNVTGFRLLSSIDELAQNEAIMAALSEDGKTLSALVKNRSDFEYFLETLPDAQRDSFIESFDNQALKAMVETAHDFMAIVEEIPETRRDSFVASFSQEKLKQFLQNPDDFSYVVAMLPDARRDSFIASFDNQVLKTFVQNPNTFSYVVAVLPDARCDSFIASFDNQVLKTFVQNPNIFSYVVAMLPDARRDSFIASFDNRLLKTMVKTARHFTAIVEKIPETRLDSFFNSFDNHELITLTKTARDFSAIAKALPEAQRDLFFTYFDQETLKKFIQNPNDFLDVVKRLPTDRRYSLITSYDNQALKTFGQNADAFSYVVLTLPDARRDAFLASFDDQSLKALIKEGSHFLYAVQALSETRKDSFIASFEVEALNFLVQNAKDFSYVMKVLPESRKHSFVESFYDHKLKTFVKNFRDFTTIVETLSETRRDSFLASLKDSADLKTYRYRYVIKKMMADLLQAMRTPLSHHVANRWRFAGTAVILTGAAFAAGYLLSNASIIAITVGTLTGAALTGGIFAAAALLIMLAVALALYHSQVFSQKPELMSVDSAVPSPSSTVSSSDNALTASASPLLFTDGIESGPTQAAAAGPISNNRKKAAGTNDDASRGAVKSSHAS